MENKELNLALDEAEQTIACIIVHYGMHKVLSEFIEEINPNHSEWSHYLNRVSDVGVKLYRLIDPKLFEEEDDDRT